MTYCFVAGGKIGAKAAAASSAWSSTKVPGRSSSPLPAAAQRPADKLPVRCADMPMLPHTMWHVLLICLKLRLHEVSRSALGLH